VKIDIEKEPVNENVLKMEQYKKEILKGVDVIEISGTDQILENLSLSEEITHPEKRVKAVYFILKLNRLGTASWKER